VRETLAHGAFFYAAPRLGKTEQALGFICTSLSLKTTFEAFPDAVACQFYPVLFYEKNNQMDA
jgi:hypothetical protein